MVPMPMPMPMPTSMPISVVSESGLTTLRAAVDELSAVDLTGCDDQDLLAFVREFERLRNRLSRIDHQIVSAIDRVGLVERWVARSAAGVLHQALGVSRAEARRRVSAATALGGSQTLTGEPLAPRFPALAALETSGLLGREQRDVALQCVRTLDTRFGAGDDVLARADRSLARHAPDLDPDGLRTVAQHIVDVEYPGGLLPDDAQVDAAREVQLRAEPDGSYRLSGTLTGEAGALLATVLDTFGRPRPRALDEPGSDSARPTAFAKDTRSPAQRRHDALLTACHALLRADLPQHGGVPTTVIITIALDDLLQRTGAGRTGDGQDLSPETVARLLHESEILPTVLDRRGRVRWQESHQRCATAGQTLFLTARDGGCSFPGCDEPPAHCERHHIVPWAEGGPTAVDNLTMVCGYHHREFARRGWRCRMIDELPHWVPPRWVEPDQLPRLHARLRIRRINQRLDVPRRT